ncbi:MAG: CPBP family intramembrane metalloprotease [Chloroflexi bacterium]|nr:CPBP family intramembrane metalloprotease [Chloroflexota bacterium]
MGDLIYAGFHVFILWGKAHVLSVVLAISALTFIGWFWRQLYRRQGGLLASVLGHMAADFFILLVVFYAKM